jgi:hypothetical protein
MTDQKYMKPVIFLTGHRKSGTSLLAKLFDGHDQVSCYPTDISLLYAFFPLIEEGLINDATEKYERFRHVITESIRLSLKDYLSVEEIEKIQTTLNRKLETLIHNKAFCNKASVLTLIANWLSENNPRATQVLLKETSQLQNYATIKSIYPNSKIINIIRDPRDNMAAIYEGLQRSYSKIGDDEHNILFTVANKAMIDLKLAANFDQRNQLDILNIRYEDLVSNAKNVLQSTCRFLDISFKESMLTPTQSGYPYHGNNHQGKKFSGISNINCGRWRERLPDEYSAFIEFFCSSEMLYWNYRPEFKLDETLSLTQDLFQKYNYKYFFRDRYGE